MPKHPMKKAAAKKTSVKKTSVKPKAKSDNKDYMKPVGGTKQEGYMAPGSTLYWDNTGNQKTEKGYQKRPGSGGYQVGKSATDRLSTLQSLGVKGINQSQQYLKTGINPAAMKATAGNPKPTTAQMATAKKKAAAKAKGKAMETQAQKKKNTKPVKGSTKGSTLKSPKPSPSPSTGRYKRNP